LHPSDELEAVAVGQLQVGQAQVERLGLEQPLGGADAADGAGVQVHPLQRDGEEFTQIGFVVDDQYGGIRHARSVRSAGAVPQRRRAPRSASRCPQRRSARRSAAQTAAV
jgi:hypothetical protein